MEVDQNFVVIEALKIFKTILKDYGQIIISQDYCDKIVIRNCYNKKKKNSYFLEVKEDEKC